LRFPNRRVEAERPPANRLPMPGWPAISTLSLDNGEQLGFQGTAWMCPWMTPTQIVHGMELHVAACRAVMCQTGASPNPAMASCWEHQRRVSA
jgi:hypothetical protein